MLPPEILPREPNSTGKLLITSLRCRLCDESSKVLVERAEYSAWLNGMKLVEAFKSLDNDDLELLNSGSHAACKDVYEKTNRKRVEDGY